MKIFTSDPDAWMRLVYAILIVQYTVHVQGRIANISIWKWVNYKYWFLHPLLSSIANLITRKNVLKSPFSKNLTREIYGVYSICSGSLENKFLLVSNKGTDIFMPLLKDREMRIEYPAQGHNYFCLLDFEQGPSHCINHDLIY